MYILLPPAEAQGVSPAQIPQMDLTRRKGNDQIPRDQSPDPSFWIQLSSEPHPHRTSTPAQHSSTLQEFTPFFGPRIFKADPRLPFCNINWIFFLHFLQNNWTEGKMNFLNIFCTILCVSNSLGSPISISPDLLQNQLRFPYGINFKFNGMVHQNLDRVWIVTKFPLPKWEDIKWDKEMEWNDNCTLLKESERNEYKEKLQTMCTEIRPRMKKIREENMKIKEELHQLVIRDLYDALPGLWPESGREPRGLGTLIIGGLFTVATEVVSSFMRRKRERMIQKALVKLQKQNKYALNRVKQMENDFMLYGEYNIQTLEGIMKAIGNLSQTDTNIYKVMNRYQIWKDYYGMQNYPMFGYKLEEYFKFQERKHIDIYRRLIEEYRKVIRATETLSKGYLPPELITIRKLREITQEVTRMLSEKHPTYTLALDRLSHYYDMKLVTFQLDPKSHSLIITFPVFIKEFHEDKMALYEIETVHVPIQDKNTKADSYTKVKTSKPYIAINNEFYIQLRIQELRMCKRINFEYYCEELFVVKHMSKPCCESALFFQLRDNIIKRNCEFEYFFNKTIMPSVLDGGSQIILANFLTKKRIICTNNHNLAAPLPSHAYVMINRSLLCNCKIESEMTHILKTLGACDGTHQSKQAMLFTINMAFQLHFKEDFNSSLPKLLPENITLQENAYPLSLTNLKDLRTNNAPQTLKDLMTDMKRRRQMLDKLNPDKQAKTWDYISTHSKNKNNSDFFQFLDDEEDEHEFLEKNESKIFTFAASCAAVLTFIALIILICKFKKLKTFAYSVALYKLPKLSAEPLLSPQGAINFTAQLLTDTSQQEKVLCYNPTLTAIMTIVTAIGAVLYLYSLIRKMTWCKGYKFTNNCSLFLFVVKDDRFIPIKLTSFQGHLMMIKLQGFLRLHDVTLNSNILWDTIQINWENAHILIAEKEHNMPTNICLPLTDKIKTKYIFNQNNPSFMFMVKQGQTWYNLQSHTIQRDPSIHGDL